MIKWIILFGLLFVKMEVTLFLPSFIIVKMSLYTKHKDKNSYNNSTTEK